MPELNKNSFLFEDYASSNELINVAEEILYDFARKNVDIVYFRYYNILGDAKFEYSKFVPDLDERLSALIKNPDNYPQLMDFILYSKLFITIVFFEGRNSSRVFFRKPNQIILLYGTNDIKLINGYVFKWFNDNYDVSEFYNEKIKIPMSDEIATNIIYNILTNPELEFLNDLVHELKHAYDYHMLGNTKFEKDPRAIEYQKKQKEFYENEYLRLKLLGLSDEEINRKHSPSIKYNKLYSNQYLEIWARVAELFTQIKYKNIKSFNDAVNYFKDNFSGYNYLSEKDKKKIINKLYDFHSNHFKLPSINNNLNEKNINLNSIINEELLNLTEARDTKNRSKARNYLRNLGYNDNYIKRIEQGLMNDLSPFIRDSEFKFMMGAARFFHEKTLRSGYDIRKLKDLIKLINDSHLEEYDNNFNGEDFNDLYRKFETKIKHDFEKDQQALSQKQFTSKSDYEVIPINSYEDAAPYSEYTKWCITSSEGAYKTYTSNGLGTFYFLLKNGFENIPEERGQNSPKDEYGLSMIAVSVDEFGGLNSSTTRWNHSCGGTDNMFTTEEISNLIGQNFYNALKPRYTEEEIIQKIKTDGEYVKYNDYLTFIVFNKRFYQLDSNGDFDIRRYYDNVLGFDNNGFAVVEKDKKYNFINTEGKLISPMWFDDVYNFENGFAVINKNYQYNFINTDGKILSPMWFDNFYGFHNDGFAVVKKDNKYNIINTDGKILSPNMWFNDADYFDNSGFAVVKKDNKYNFINTDGKIVSPNMWFDDVYAFKNNGFAKVKKDNKYNFINTDGKILSPNMWFDDVYAFNNNGIAKVEKDNKYNFINTDGKILFPNMWFSSVTIFYSNGFAAVEKDNQWNFINTDGKILSPNIWFDNIYGFQNGFAKVKKDNKLYYIDDNGELYDNNKNKINDLTEGFKIKNNLNEIILEEVQNLFEKKLKQ